MRTVWFLLALGVFASAAQAQPWQFERVERLPHNTILALLEDHRGFLWIGTPDGLARYDGRRVRVYRGRPGSPGSLPSPTVQALAEGPDGALWVGTPVGMCRLEDEARGGSPASIRERMCWTPSRPKGPSGSVIPEGSDGSTGRRSGESRGS